MMVYTASWKTCTFLFKENPIKADEERLDSAGHYTRRLESEFVPHVLIVSETPSVTEAPPASATFVFRNALCDSSAWVDGFGSGARESDPNIFTSLWAVTQVTSPTTSSFGTVTRDADPGDVPVRR